MKKALFTLSGLLAIASITQLEARWHANINFGYNRPRHVYRPIYIQEPMYYPTYCYPYAPVQYYPTYPQPVVQYVDNRDPEVAMMQDGFNMMFDTMSHASKRSHRKWRRCR